MLIKMDDLTCVYRLLQLYGFTRPDRHRFVSFPHTQEILVECCEKSFGYLVQRELDNIVFPHPDIVANIPLLIWIIRQLEMTYEGNKDDLWNSMSHTPRQLQPLLDCETYTSE